MQNFISCLLLLLSFTAQIAAQTLSKETVVIETAYGQMKIKLYEETPLHKENFLKLVRDHYFDSLLFHRVINNFMIQGGDHKSKHASATDSLGDGDIGYTVPAEFNSRLIHKKGRLCAARESDDINPEKASSASQFYVVMGKKRTREDLTKYEERINKTYYVNCAREYLKTPEGFALKKEYNRLKSENKADSAAEVNKKIEEQVKVRYNKKPEYKFSLEQIDAYMTVGGTPHLDGSYTVFGEVIEGLEVIDKIAAVKTGYKDRPVEDVRMVVRLLE